MFTTFIVKPIFNLLVLIYALLPGHNFGLSIIIFTVVIRLLLWPLLKKQLHQAKVMRQLQPELKRIKKEAKGDRQKESLMLMELYKERGVNPFGQIGILFLQLPILIGLYSGLRRVVADPHALVKFAYPSLQHLPWMEKLAHNIHLFDSTLFGFVDLTRAAAGKGSTYWPAFLIVIVTAVMQYYQSKQLMPNDKNSRKLRHILRDAGSGKQADQSEVNAAVGRSTRWLLPAFIFLAMINLPSAIGLYWLVGGAVALIQQGRVLRQDETEMETLADKPGKNVAAIPEAEVIKDSSKPSSKSKKSSKKRKKR
ncbi:MAG TPA: YidC/Oxa1 family membrane protein insertase [Candidatus Saccharimonadales bacterium]|nr:YidC/Oxa1 family membrane protein insertase [Candidatus Saccharimonadales bacterium]